MFTLILLIYDQLKNKAYKQTNINIFSILLQRLRIKSISQTNGNIFKLEILINTEPSESLN